VHVPARILTTLPFDLKATASRTSPAHRGVLRVSNLQGNLDPVLLAVRPTRPEIERVVVSTSDRR
jgi:hypothetical protein